MIHLERTPYNIIDKTAGIAHRYFICQGLCPCNGHPTARHLNLCACYGPLETVSIYPTDCLCVQLSFFRLGLDQGLS